jgi:hypothetical protein
MTATELVNPVVRTAVTALNSGDRATFVTLLAPGAQLTDDGTPQDPLVWVDREVFSAHGSITVLEQRNNGLSLIAHFHSDQWDFERTFWHFTLADAHIARLDVGQE